MQAHSKVPEDLSNYFTKKNGLRKEIKKNKRNKKLDQERKQSMEVRKLLRGEMNKRDIGKRDAKKKRDRPVEKNRKKDRK